MWVEVNAKEPSRGGWGELTLVRPLNGPEPRVGRSPCFGCTLLVRVEEDCEGLVALGDGLGRGVLGQVEDRTGPSTDSHRGGETDGRGQLASSPATG